MPARHVLEACSSEHHYLTGYDEGQYDAGYEAGYELGPGKVLSGIMKRVDKKAPAITNVEV